MVIRNREEKKITSNKVVPCNLVILGLDNNINWRINIIEELFY